MRDYRKKPVVIQAVQFTEDIHKSLVNEVFSSKENPINLVLPIAPDCAFTWNWHTNQLEIPTLEGNHIVSVGDYIIKGVAGEYYACKPDIFERTYEIV